MDGSEVPVAIVYCIAVFLARAARSWNGHTASFDYLVGDNKQLLWNAQAERFSRLEIDHKLVLDGPLDGKIAGRSNIS